MKTDFRPAHENETMSARDFPGYVREYAAAVQSALASVPAADLESALAVVREARRADRKVFVAGNGGSAAIANHLCCDFTKGTFSDRHTSLRTESLSANPSLLLAIANDQNFESCFSTQLELLARTGDVAILISSSGKSPNLIRAAEACKKIGVKTIAMTGFEGGDLRKKADVALHVDARNYGVIEDCHQSLMHCIAQFLVRE